MHSDIARLYLEDSDELQSPIADNSFACQVECCHKRPNIHPTLGVLCPEHIKEVSGLMDMTFTTTMNLSVALLEQRVRILTSMISDRKALMPECGATSIYWYPKTRHVDSDSGLEGDAISADFVENEEIDGIAPRSPPTLPWISTTTRLPSIIESDEESEAALSTGSTSGI
ncbi:MAG: hypothetical protein CYPHOPRED_000827 [Cyphobasidiales sp. Tagirdzhanova-0007]|nr:MAG: hypothetical protein CYPHOPRED_000827 [Cyphobasidiales sp. Tagirdzhanova-0007]